MKWSTEDPDAWSGNSAAGGIKITQEANKKERDRYGEEQFLG